MTRDEWLACTDPPPIDDGPKLFVQLTQAEWLTCPAAGTGRLIRNKEIGYGIQGH
jgi:hypothetical protein